MRSPSPTKIRLGLTAQFWLWGVVIFITAFLMAILLLWIGVRNDTQARLTREVDTSLDTMSSNLANRTDDLEMLGSWIQQQRELASLIQPRDSTALTRYLEPIERTSIVDAIVVLDNYGTVVWQETNNQIGNGTASALDDPGIAQVLSGHTSRGLIQDGQGHLEQRLVVPIYNKDSQVPVGAVILAFYLDGDLFKNISKDDTVSTAIIYRNRVVASSISDAEGKTWLGSIIPSQVLQAGSAELPSEFSSITTSYDNYLFKFRPLLATDRTIIGYYGAGVPSSAMNGFPLALPRLVNWEAALALLFLLAFLLLLARILATPIQKLGTTAAALADGDLTMRPIYWRDNEIGDIFRELDRVRQQLRRAKSAATFDASYQAALLQGMSAAAIITDADYGIVTANAAALGLLRENSTALLHRKWQTVFAENDYLALPASVTHSGARGRFSLRSQPQVILDVHTAPIQVNGQIEGYVHTLQDVSEQAKFEESKNDFVLNLAHELRSPLASLRAYIDLIVDDHAVMPQHDLGVMLRTLQRVVIKFQGLTENLIDIGSLQSGQFAVRPVPSPIGQLIEDAADQTQLLLRSTGQRLEFRVQDPQALVWADRPRIIQVIVNLLNNAHKYGPEQSTITLATCYDDGQLFIGVTDQGDGIAPEEQSLIFSRYFRGKRAEQEGIGLGVGLALVKGIVEAHAGHVFVKSLPGETTFCFSLPIAHPS